MDIFPSLNTPKIYVFLDYIGMSPDQMEGFIVNQLELYFQYVDGIRDIDTRNPASRLVPALILPWHRYGTGDGPGGGDVRPGNVMDAQRDPAAHDHADGCRQRPSGLPGASGERDLAGYQMGDYAQNIIRPLVQKFVPGPVAISPFGPNMRSIVVNVDPQKLLDYNLTSQEVIEAVAKGNTIIPAGNIFIKDSMPVVSNNATVVDIDTWAMSRSQWRRTSTCETWRR